MNVFDPQLLKDLLMSNRRSKHAQARVDSRMRKFLCLDEEPCDRRCDEPGGSGGKCSKHYARWRLKNLNKPDEVQLANQKREARKGFALYPNEIRKYRKPGKVAG